nr:hypothetical protein [Burkholderia anthina]
MIVRPFLLPGTGGISYLFGCGGKATGAVDFPRAADAVRRAAGG